MFYRLVRFIDQTSLAFKRLSIVYRVVEYRRGGRVAIRRVLQSNVKEFYASTIVRHMTLYRYFDSHDLRQIIIIAHYDSSSGGMK